MSPRELPVEGAIQMRFGAKDRVSRVMSHGNRMTGQREIRMHDTNSDGSLTRFGSLSPATSSAERRRFQLLGVRVDFVNGSRRNKELGCRPRHGGRLRQQIGCSALEQ